MHGTSSAAGVRVPKPERAVIKEEPQPRHEMPASEFMEDTDEEGDNHPFGVRCAHGRGVTGPAGSAQASSGLSRGGPLPRKAFDCGTIVEPGAPDESFLESLGHEVLARDPCSVDLVESAQGEGNQDTLRYRWWRLNCPVTHFDAHGRVDVCRMIGQIGLAEEASCSAS